MISKNLKSVYYLLQ